MGGREVDEEAGLGRGWVVEEEVGEEEEENKKNG